MKKNFLFPVLAVVAVLSAACSSEPENYDFVSPHFVNCYYYLTNVTPLYDTARCFIALQPSRTDFYVYRDLKGEKEGSEREIFDSLAQKNGDINFNKTVYCTIYLPVNGSIGSGMTFENYEASASDIVSIDITADKAWDATHPAGSSLVDLFYFDALNMYLYIKSGYSDAVDPWSHVHMLMSEMTEDDYRMTLYAYYNPRSSDNNPAYDYNNFPQCCPKRFGNNIRNEVGTK